MPAGLYEEISGADQRWWGRATKLRRAKKAKPPLQARVDDAVQISCSGAESVKTPVLRGRSTGYSRPDAGREAEASDNYRGFLSLAPCRIRCEVDGRVAGRFFRATTVGGSRGTSVSEAATPSALDWPYRTRTVQACCSASWRGVMSCNTDTV